MDLGAMTVSLRADLTGLEAGLQRAQELVTRSSQALALQEERFQQAGAAARDYGAGAARWLTSASEAVGGLGQSATGLQRKWSGAWEAMDAAADSALARITRRFGHAVAGMIVDGRGLRDFWRGLWRDLVEIAVQRLMQMVLQTRTAAAAMGDALGAVSGGLFGSAGGLLGGLLGGVLGGAGSLLRGIGRIFGFDNPAHDAWARRQGFDFGRQFRAGVNAAMAMPISRPVNLSPALALAGIGSVGGPSLRAVNLAIAQGAVQIHAVNLDERTVRDAGGILADEVSRRLGWTDKRSGL